MPKTLHAIEPTTIELLDQLAGQAPAEIPTPTHQSAEKRDPGGSHKSDLGPLQVETYLQHYGVAFSVKQDAQGNRTLYRLSRCLFDPGHTRNEAAIVQDPSGKITYHCVHNSCRSRTWADARKEISGEDSLVPFCEGYDPNWRPSGSSGSSSKKNKTTKHGSSAPTAPWFDTTGTGRLRFNPALLADHLEAKYQPIIWEGKFIVKRFYRYAESGVWRMYPEDSIRKYVRRALGAAATPERITRAVSLVQDQVFVPPEDLEVNPMMLNLQNGMLDLETMELKPHDPAYMSRIQLPVTYDPKATCSMWIEKLGEIFADDVDKADVLHQFFGYCLYPKIVFPCCLFQIGGGGNGKGVVERVLYSMLGRENVCHISLARMEKDFGPIEIRDKLLNSCGETETKALDVTNFKKIVAGDRIQAEVKYGSDVKFIPIAKHMISMNDFPGLKDKTDAFFRRIIVLEYRQRFEIGKDADPFLADKLIDQELDGIFNWALAGLKRVLKQGAVEVPESVDAAKHRLRSKVNPVLVFVSEECLIDPNYFVSPPKLYAAYKRWAEESKVQALGKMNFYENVLQNFPGVKRTRPADSTKEVFRGIGLAEDPMPMAI